MSAVESTCHDFELDRLGSQDLPQRGEGSFVSIFERVCPQCATTNSVSSVRCGCGYCFDSNQTTSLDQTAQEEQLYLDYLAARIAQAAETLDFARAAAARDPELHALAAEVIAAEQALRTARAEHAVQVARVRSARQQVMTARSVARPAPVLARTVIAPPAAEPVVAAPAPRPVVVASAPEPVIVASTVTKKVKPLPRQTAATLAARAKALKPKHRSIASAIRSKLARQGAPISRPSAPTPQPPTNAVPPAPFRAKQAARAEHVVEQQRAASFAIQRAPANLPTAPRPQASVTVTPKSAAAPGIRAAAPASRVPTKSCPSCGNRLAAAATRCNCGYEVSDGPELPGLSVSAPAVVVQPEAPGKTCPHCSGKVTASMTNCRCGYEFSDGPDIPGLPPISEADKDFLFDFGVLKPA
ncbi:MAG: hypothetical protein AMJ84_11855 [Acidithiobacillales bacterium SM23_46]|nr:MAG: hypothetical protein AMJ84_11855 [Acidithiobacillales bacterium SM23_46]